MFYKKTLFFFTLFSLLHPSFSQNDINSRLFSTTSIQTFQNKRNIEGTKYINKEFKTAIIDNYNNKKYFAKYNALDDLFEVKQNGVIKYLTPNSNLEITFLHPKKTYKPFIYKNNSKGFFVVDSINQDLILLTKEVIKFYEEIKNTSAYSEYQAPKLKRESNIYFLKRKQNPPIKLSVNKRKFLKNFKKSKRNEIKKFIKGKNLKDKNILIIILSHYTPFLL